MTVGQKVFHDKFGTGTVTALVNQGADSKAVVQFDNFGSKTMLLRFAKLKTVLE